MRKRPEKYERLPRDSANSSLPPSKGPVKSEGGRRAKSPRQKSDNHVGDRRDTKVQRAGRCSILMGLRGFRPNIARNAAATYPAPIESRITSRKGQTCHRLCRYTVNVDSAGKSIPAVVVTVAMNHGARGGEVLFITFGKNIRTTAAYLNVVQCMPYERLQSLFAAMFNVPTSQGTLVNILRGMPDKSRPAVSLTERPIKKSPAVGFDKSGCYGKGRPNWSWTAQTTGLTPVSRGSGHGVKILEERFGDFLNNQACPVHLLRNLEYLDDIGKGQIRTMEMLQLMREAVHGWKMNPSVSILINGWTGRPDKLLKKKKTNLRKGATN